MLDFCDVLIRPKESTLNSRSEVSLSCTKKKFKHSPMAWTGTPIIVSNMDTTGTFEIYKASKEYGIITALHKFYTADDYRDACKKYKLDPNNFMVTVGLMDIDNLVEISKVVAIKWICIDVANGYIPKLLKFCKIVRKLFPDNIIVAGNVVTAERTVELLESGVDIVKVGIGPGAACTTRIQTGIGMPQLSAIQECAEAAHRHGGMIIGDGGITCPGDMVKAFGGGADFVMAGSLFAGHAENPGCTIEENGSMYKLFYGMSSRKAMERHGGVKDYRTSEGRALKIRYKGDIKNTILDYFGGIRSACTYIGAKSIDLIHKNTTFLLVKHQANFSLVR